MLEMKCIVAIVERGKADKIVNAAKEVGSSGATVFYGRGTGESEVKKFLNMHIEASKEIIIILTEEDKLKTIMDAMIKTGKLKDPGTGVIFSLSIDNLVGLYHRKDFKM